MKLVFALGNPEQRYDNTRHNVGFLVADKLAEQNGLKWATKTKFKAQIVEAGDYLIAKPTTYYNLVGESARAIADFYNIKPQDILIIHDDMALPLGTVRTRLGGSPAGNNGIKSLNQHLGEGTARLRIGTWTELADRMDAANFVLSKLNRADNEALAAQAPNIMQLISDFTHGNFAVTTQKTDN